MTAAHETRDLPEPREGVTGIDRTGDPLVTSDAAKPLIARLTRQLWSACLSHGPRDSVYYDQYQRMVNPVRGDQVVVYDAVIGPDPDRIRWGVGYLVLSRREWWDTHEDWEQMKVEDPDLTEEDRRIEREVWYVQYGPSPGQVCRWVNCKVIAIPPNEV